MFRVFIIFRVLKSRLSRRSPYSKNQKAAPRKDGLITQFLIFLIFMYFTDTQIIFGGFFAHFLLFSYISIYQPRRSYPCFNYKYGETVNIMNIPNPPPFLKASTINQWTKVLLEIMSFRGMWILDFLRLYIDFLMNLWYNSYTINDL